MKKPSLSAVTLLLLFFALALFFFPANIALADGTETLGPPSITLATGTGIVAAGTGTAGEQPETIEITVPDGTTVKQVLLYWEGQMAQEEPGDPTIVLNGSVEVTGQRIGGPAFFFQGAYSSAYRADITSLNLISAGANSVSVEGLEFTKVANGAGILVIYDDGSTPAAIGLRDGVDLAYIGFPQNQPRHATIAQTIDFTPAEMDRTANVVIFASSVAGAVSGEDIRPDSIEVTIDDVTTVFSDRLSSTDGEEWDTLQLAVPVPAGASRITIQLFSRDDFNTGNVPASMTWIGSAFAIVPPQASISLEKATNGEDADVAPGPQILVGDSVTWTYVVVNTGNLTLNNITVTDDQIGDIDCPQSTLTPGASMTCTATGTAVAGQYENTGEVTGTPTDGGPQVTDSDPSHYFGTALAAVGDKVFRDENANGIQDPGEPGVDGIIVGLYSTDDTLITSTTTVDGMYLFDNLQPGSYYIRFVNPTGAGTCTTPNAGGDDSLDSDGIPIQDTAEGPACETAPFTLSAGQTDLTWDLGLVYPAVPATVGDKVFRDENANGIQDPGEPGVDGIIVELYSTDDTLISSTTTVDGMYLFDNLEPGSYYIRFVNPTGAGTCTTPNAGGDDSLDSDGIPIQDTAEGPACETAPFTLSAGQTDLTQDLGLVYPQPGINLEKATNGEDADVAPGPRIAIGGPVTWTYDVTNTGNVTLTNIAVTDDQIGPIGTCPLTTLAPGATMSCIVTGTAIAGQYANIGTVTGTPTDNSGMVSDTDPSHYFGSQLAAVGSTVFIDIDPDAETPSGIALGNGLQDGDARERGVDGIIVKLYDSNNELISRTVTANGGQYLFDNLEPGEYCLVFINQSGDGVWTDPNIGNNDEIDSDVSEPVTDPEGGDAIGTPCFTLEPGEVDLSWDAGLTELSGTASAGAGNFVWIDEDADGIQDPGEVGRPNVTVQIFTADGTLVQTTQTDAQGIYNFTALDPGTYYVQFTIPTECELTLPNVGTNDEVDSDVTADSNRTDEFTLEAFELNPRLDMGITCTPSGLDPDEEPLQNKVYLPFIQ